MSRVVVFEATGEERTVEGTCARCFPNTWVDELPDQFVVSANGIAHHGADYGMTACGKDATGPAWWWPI